MHVLLSTSSEPSDVNARGIYGNTALHVCSSMASENLKSMLEVLLKNGLDPSLRNCSGQTAVSVFRRLLKLIPAVATYSLPKQQSHCCRDRPAGQGLGYVRCTRRSRQHRASPGLWDAAAPQRTKFGADRASCIPSQFRKPDRARHHPDCTGEGSTQRNKPNTTARPSKRLPSTKHRKMPALRCPSRSTTYM